jgi:MtfA peptidase
MNLIILADLSQAMPYLVGVVAALVLLAVWRQVRRLRRRVRRRKLRAQPFPGEWATTLQENVPLYRRLPEELRGELHGHIQVFLGEKRFEGCGGLEITDEIRVTIAAQACMLLLGRRTTHYPTLSSVLVYPGAYVIKGRRNMGGVSVEGQVVVAGESWTRGEVVIAWDQALQGAANVTDGHDVVLHEFAHQLDQEDGRADGAPILEHASSYTTWAQVLGEEYDHLRKKTKRRRRSLLRKYGATNPAEFFAVATETFFEKARHMKRKMPDLYEELKDYYHLDPATWREPEKTEK